VTGVPVPQHRQTPAGRTVEMALFMPPSLVLAALPLRATNAALRDEDQSKSKPMEVDFFYRSDRKKTWPIQGRFTYCTNADAPVRP
jgi:hypothetical protein